MARIINTADIPKDLSKFEDHQVYNALDCCITVEVWKKRLSHFDKNTWMTYLNSKDVQAPALEMQLRGIQIDEAAAYDEIQTLTEEINILEDYFSRLSNAACGEVVKWRSPMQLKRMLNNLGFKCRGTDRDTLEGLKIHFFAEPIVNAILALRDRDKLRSNLQNASRKRTGRWHAQFKVAGTKTGRLSSSKDPFGEGWNLQNINDRTRQVFVAPPGWKLAYIDLEQAESRAVAYLSGDENYIAACESGDLHTLVCRMVWQELEWTDVLKQDKAVAEQIFYRFFTYRDMAKRGGHGCLTEDHEVLTPDGWVPITDKPDIIAQWTQDGISWASPSHWEDKPWYDDLVHLQSNSVDLLATNDHRVIYIPSKSDKYKEAPAGDLPATGNIPLGHAWTEGHHYYYAKLLAAYQADGHLKSPNTISFNFHKERKVERLVNICKELGVNYRFSTDGKVIVYWTPDYPKVAGPYLLTFSHESLVEYYQEHSHWDGSKNKASTTITAIDREHLEWLQTVGRLVGFGGNIQKPQKSGFGSTTYRLQQNKRKFSTLATMKKTKKAGKGVRVICPTVPSGAFMVRRNGRISVTGNTNYYGKAYTMAKHLKIPKEVMQDFQDRYIERFPGIQEWWYRIMRDLMTDGWLMTPYGRFRRFFGRPDDDATIRKAIAFEPQSLIADIINTGIWRLWKNYDSIKLLAQVHDAVLFMFPEDEESDIIPQATKTLEIPISVNNRTLIIPAEANTGWNWGHYDSDNPGGIRKFGGHDDRERPRERSILDARC